MLYLLHKTVELSSAKLSAHKHEAGPLLKPVHDLLARARSIEEHEKQFSVSAQSCGDGTKSSTVKKHSTFDSLPPQGRALPELEQPTVCLYGKDDKKGSNQLVITAQVPLVFTLDNIICSVPVFIQPNSEQACLMGMNVIPLLGIRIVRSTGMPVLPSDIGD